MSAPETTGNAARYADLEDRDLADVLAREDEMDDAWNAGGAPGSPPRRDTCHPCVSWADHDHSPEDGRRVELDPAELHERSEYAIERAVYSDMAHDPDEGAWGLYGALRALDEQRAREAAAAMVDRIATPRREPEGGWER